MFDNVKKEIVRRKKFVIKSIVSFFISKAFRMFSYVISFVFLLFVLKLIVGESGVVDLVGSLSWPVAIVLVSFVFKESIENVAKRVHEFSGLGVFFKAHSDQTAESADQLNADEEDVSLEAEEKSDGKVEDTLNVNENSPNNKGESDVDKDLADSSSLKNESLHARNLNKKLSYIASRTGKRVRVPIDNDILTSGSSNRDKIKRLINTKKAGLLVAWNNLKKDIDQIFYYSFDSDKDNGDITLLDKMSLLRGIGAVSTRQLNTFENLYEASSFFSSDIPFASIHNYKQSVEALSKSLKNNER